MSTINELLRSIQASPTGLTLSELLAQHPQVARRTAQRLISQMIAAGLISARSEGRARRYYPVSAIPAVPQSGQFPDFIPLSADSMDIAAYIDLVWCCTLSDT